MKNKPIRTLTAVMLALCLLLGTVLCSCGGQTENPTEDTTVSPVETTGQEKDPEPKAPTPEEKLAAAFENLRKTLEEKAAESPFAALPSLMEAAGQNGSVRLSANLTSLLGQFVNLNTTITADVKAYPGNIIQAALDLDIGSPIDMTLFPTEDGAVVVSEVLTGNQAIRVSEEDLADLLALFDVPDEGGDGDDVFDYDNYYYDYADNGIYAYALADATFLPAETQVVDYVDNGYYAILDRSAVIGTVPREEYESGDFVPQDNLYYSDYDYCGFEGDILIFPADAQAIFITETECLVVYTTDGVLLFERKNFADFYSYDEELPGELYEASEDIEPEEDTAADGENLAASGLDMVRTLTAFLTANEETLRGWLPTAARQFGETVKAHLTVSQQENQSVTVGGETTAADIITLTVSDGEMLPLVQELCDLAKADDTLSGMGRELLTALGSEQTVDDLYAAMEAKLKEMGTDVSAAISVAIRLSDGLPVRIQVDRTKGASETETVYTMEFNPGVFASVQMTAMGMTVTGNTTRTEVNSAETEEETVVTVTTSGEEGEKTVQMNMLFQYNSDDGALRMSISGREQGEEQAFYLGLSAILQSLDSEKAVVVLDSLSIQAGDTEYGVPLNGLVELTANDPAPALPTEIKSLEELTEEDWNNLLGGIMALLPA